MDALSELIRILAPAGRVDLRCQLAGSWATDEDPQPSGQLPYHVILEGRAQIECGGKPLLLEAGDVVLLPHGDAHLLRNVGGRRASTAAPSLRSFNGVVGEVRIAQAGVNAATDFDMLCGVFALGQGSGLLLRHLPEVVRIRTARRDDCAWLPPLIAMMQSESEALRAGGIAVIGELSTALFVLLLRAMLADGTIKDGTLALLRHPRLSVAIEAVIREPQRPWTVELLAQHCNLARATFARQFAELSAMTPLAFVASLRMEQAARLLTQTTLPAALVGERCGYASQAAFGRAFKQHHGALPNEYRRRFRQLQDQRQASLQAVR